MTTKQLQLIHQAARQVGLANKGDDARYRLLLKNVAGVESSRNLTNSQFEDVMAVLESMGFSNARARQQERASFMAASGSASSAISTYWQDKVARRGSNANERLLFKLRDMIKSPHMRYELAALCSHVIGRRTDDLSTLTPGEAFKLIEAMKQIIEREQGSTSFDRAQATIERKRHGARA